VLVAARRRRNRTVEPVVETEDGIAVQDLATHHLLLVPTTVDIDSVDIMFRDRMPTSDLYNTGEVQIGRHSRISGPYQLSMEDAVDAGVPMPWTVCYCLEAPVEREDPPIPGTDDRDGFAYAFPEGLPWRDEGRALHLLVSMARRLSGAVRVAGSLELIQPDPERAVDYIVHSPTWMEPEVLLGVVSRVLPGATLAVEGQDWAGPPDEAYTGELIQADIIDDPLTPQDLYQLHASADTVDMQMLAEADVIDAFAIVGDVGWDGVIEVLVHLTDGEDPTVAGQPWSQDDLVTYEVRWGAPDPVERENRYPSEIFRASRARVAPLIAKTTRAIVEAASGIVLDEDGFSVDRYTL
jgi:hypothetical protein